MWSGETGGRHRTMINPTSATMIRAFEEEASRGTKRSEHRLASLTSRQSKEAVDNPAATSMLASFSTMPDEVLKETPLLFQRRDQLG